MEGTITVSIVDDHPVVIEGIQTWLRAEPRIQVVGTGDSVAGVKPGVDVLLLDLNLHGRLVVDEVAGLADAGHRVIVFSQFTEQNLVLAALDAGAREFVAKHEGRTHLVDAVLAVAADRPYVTPTEAGVLADDHRPDRPVLSERERMALLLWFRSMSKAAVARRMEVSPHTVDMFIRRARLKYAQAGRSAHTKADLLARAIEDGLITPEHI
jgi:two-component system nitrate/nitrite response regulator NarL